MLISWVFFFFFFFWGGGGGGGGVTILSKILHKRTGPNCLYFFDDIFR